MDTSSTFNSKENDGLVEPMSPEFADEGWDLGFSSPFRDLMSDESPVKSDIPTTPPLSPPSLGALRLFDSPQTPKSLLERSSAVNRTIDFKRPVSRLRRGFLKGRGFESEPRTGPRSRQVTANVNPFTPEASSIGAKRTRNEDRRWAFSLWSLVFVSSLILASTFIFQTNWRLTMLHSIFVLPHIYYACSNFTRNRSGVETSMHHEYMERSDCRIPGPLGCTEILPKTFLGSWKIFAV